jgi:hypothetical protein
LKKLTKAQLRKLEKECVRTKAPPDPNKLHPGDLVDANGAIWECLAVTSCAATMKGVYGKGKGAVQHWAPSAIVKKMTAEEAEARKMKAAKETALEEDEFLCPNCYPEDREGRGENDRDINCPDHQPRPETVKKAREGKRKRRQPETPEDIKKVLALRGTGENLMPYQKIEKAMGWPDSHGNRAWKIVKAASTAEEE